MKKILSVILVLLLTLSLCACDAKTVIQGFENLAEMEFPELPSASGESPAPAEETEVPEETPVPETDAPEAPDPVQSTMPGKVVVSIKKTSLVNYAPDSSNQLILTFAYDTPIVSIEGNDLAAHAINDFTAYLEEEHYTGMNGDEFTGYGYYGMLEQAEDNYRYVHDTGAELGVEFSSSREVDVLRADSSVLSLVYNDYVFTGGQSGISYDSAYVFSTESGMRLSFEELSADSEALRALVLEHASSAGLDEELCTRLIEGGCWYLSGEGLAVFSNDGTAQSTCFTVPYLELKDVIDAKWMPQFIDDACAFTITETPAEGTEIYDMVNVSEDGRVFYLVIEGVANQLKIASVQYADTFYETAEHWYASYANNCAIQINANIPEGMPNLMISCLGADGQIHNLLVSQSGVDGSLILTDDNIEAVG